MRHKFWNEKVRGRLILFGPLLGLSIFLHFQNCAPINKSYVVGEESLTTEIPSEGDLGAKSMSSMAEEEGPTEGLESINPCIPIRSIGINEGFTSIPGYNLGLPTTVTADDIADRMLSVQKPGAIKIWPIFQTLVNGELDSIFNDPRIKVVVYRPFDNQTKAPSRRAFPSSACGQDAYHHADLATDYGLVARILYQRFGHLKKTIILTGWEADNQIKFMNPNCSTPTTQAAFNSYRNLLQTRQNSVLAARQQNANKLLRVFHAVEVNKVPAGSNDYTVLNRSVAQMNPKPDFISFSSWSSRPYDIQNKLNKIKAVSTLPNERIFVGEWGCRVNNPNRVNCFKKHAQNTLSWGARLWFVWAYAVPGNTSYGLINSNTNQETPYGFNVIESINTQWWAPRTCQ